MLVEFKKVTQEKSGRRRWFEDDGMELILWYGPAEEPVGFQLCYHLGGEERALTWRDASGFAHARVDGGDDRPEKNLTPVLVPDGAVPWRLLREAFAERSVMIDTDVREFVVTKLRAES